MLAPPFISSALTYQVRANMGKRIQMMLKLERLGGRGATMDCLDRLRLMQKSDAEKHVSLSRMLLEARVETHERQLVWPYEFE
ncbi:hypothetical protein Tco_0858385 [Tanacetum coccineum]|uniref:Uncharacterized protein n=1 Tax=Tanacetum coccineum TaxID=301880 RepID=A0ABQ5BCZ9_9ASTR